MRRVARQVVVGNVVVGGGGPPVVQSMTTTPTHRVEETWSAIQRLVERGAAMVRVAVPDRRALEALPRLAARRVGGVPPLVADVHFSLPLALGSLRYVEKVRVNPGNLLEPPREMRATRARRNPEALRLLFAEAKARSRAIRVGVNQGSLARRVVERWGTGPQALVASALEYLGVAEEAGFGQVVVSLKASDPWEVVEANLLLASQTDVPLHVGVTEAGFGVQARARSAVGIGLLVRHGVADTIRVSLAEPPEEELPVAHALVSCARPLVAPGTVVRPWPVRGVQVEAAAPLRAASTRVRTRDGILRGDAWIPVRTVGPETVLPQQEGPCVLRLEGRFDSPGDLARALVLLGVPLPPWVEELQLPLPGPQWGGEGALGEALARVQVPLVWEAHPRTVEDLVRAMVDCAQLVQAGLLQWVEVEGGEEARAMALDILQGIGRGSWRTEILACPQCGRCRVDVSGLAQAVAREWGDIPGLRVAVMGCIVNGPGEMRGAHLGLVGEGRGTVALYRGGDAVARGVPVDRAVEALGALIHEWLGARAEGREVGVRRRA